MVVSGRCVYVWFCVFLLWISLLMVVSKQFWLTNAPIYDAITQSLQRLYQMHSYLFQWT
jgi:hypothetical protein